MRMSTPTDVSYSRLFAWGKLLLGLGAVGLGVSFGLRATEWWEFVSVLIFALLAVVLIVTAIRGLLPQGRSTATTSDDS